MWRGRAKQELGFETRRRSSATKFRHTRQSSIKSGRAVEDDGGGGGGTEHGVVGVL